MKSKKTSKSPFLLERTFSEAELEGLAHEVAKQIRTGDRVILEGPMGAGKSTFTRALLKALGVKQAFEGSPTFPIAHQYEADGKVITHIDLYRLHSLEEAEQAGLVEELWDSSKIAIVEWLSQIPELERELLSRPALTLGGICRLELNFVPDQPEIRAVKCQLPTR